MHKCGAFGALMDRIFVVLRRHWAFVSVDLPSGSRPANTLTGIGEELGELLIEDRMGVAHVGLRNKSPTAASKDQSVG